MKKIIISGIQLIIESLFIVAFILTIELLLNGIMRKAHLIAVLKLYLYISRVFLLADFLIENKETKSTFKIEIKTYFKRLLSILLLTEFNWLFQPIEAIKKEN